MLKSGLNTIRCIDCFSFVQEAEIIPQEITSLSLLKTEEIRLNELLSTVRNKKLNHLKNKPLNIGILGFGRFGQFIGKTFNKYGKITGINRSDCSAEADKMDVDFILLNDLDELFPPEGSKLDVLIMSTSILSFSPIMKKILPIITKSNILLVDVCSVKEHPRNVMLDLLDEYKNIDILCTHPMFGPESGKCNWKGLKFVYERTRIAGKVANIEDNVSSSTTDDKYIYNIDEDASNDRVERFISIFEEEGCEMIPMSAKLHDISASNSQFITHLVGRILATQGLKRTPIDTNGFQNIMKVVDSTSNDSFDLFYGLYKYNKHSGGAIEGLRSAMETVERELREMDENPK
jgi:prephenate dehydrogenase